MLTPNCSLWMIAATKLVISGIPTLSDISRKASLRNLPSCISRSTRAKINPSSLSHFPLTRPMAASKPNPASTQIVSRSSASGIALRTSDWRLFIFDRNHSPGRWWLIPTLRHPSRPQQTAAQRRRWDPSRVDFLLVRAFPPLTAVRFGA